MFPRTLQCQSSLGSPGALLSVLTQENGSDGRKGCLFNMSPAQMEEQRKTGAPSREYIVLSVTCQCLKSTWARQRITKYLQETEAKKNGTGLCRSTKCWLMLRNLLHFLSTQAWSACLFFERTCFFWGGGFCSYFQACAKGVHTVLIKLIGDTFSLCRHILSFCFAAELSLLNRCLSCSPAETHFSEKRGETMATNSGSVWLSGCSEQPESTACPQCLCSYSESQKRETRIQL